MADFKKIENRLKEEAKRLLKSGEVTVVLAYGKGFDKNHPMPYAAKNVDDVDNIVFNEYCNYNMVRYLVRYPQGTKIAVAVKAADSRAVIQLIQEEKVKREDLVLLGIPVEGMKDQKTGEVIDSKTTGGLCDPVLFDILLTEELYEARMTSPYDVLFQYEAWGKMSAGNSGKKNLTSAFAVMPAAKPARCAIVIPALLTSLNPGGVINPRNRRGT